VVLGERTKIERSLRAADLLEHGFQTHAWKALFPAQTLDTLPMAEDAMGPVTIRERVISWVCGTARQPNSKGSREKGRTLATAPVRDAPWPPW
jgi:D-alanyl-D-alanine carboxypeptidase